jgi:hypothetical protein
VGHDADVRLGERDVAALEQADKGGEVGGLAATAAGFSVIIRSGSWSVVPRWPGGLADAPEYTVRSVVAR